jgi:flagellar biosynthetic protein FliP
MPAFIISELTRGFEMGVLIFIPFIIIDMIVATVLMALGMMMLPPAMISMPFKLILFVLVDGWGIILESLVKSFN